MEKTTKVLIITTDPKQKEMLSFSFDGWGYECFFMTSSKPDISWIVKISPHVILVDAEKGSNDRLEICDSLKEDFATSFIPVILLIEKKHLRQNLLKMREGVDDYLIKPLDPLDMRIRIEMAIKRSQHSFYANPLTGLPGGVIIEETLKTKMDKGVSFAVGHVDIDNFKAFNDKYGYLKGDRVIMQTAYMLNTSLRKWGGKILFACSIQ
jgi:PleD family two-component response regulator